MATILVLASAMCVLIAPLWFVYKPPGVLLRYFQHRWPDVLWRVSTSSKTVALTIDDGPSEYTDEIMQILKSHNASATFFIIGSQITGNEEILQDLVRNGNELGNHGIPSPNCFPLLNIDEDREPLHIITSQSSLAASVVIPNDTDSIIMN